MNLEKPDIQKLKFVLAGSLGASFAAILAIALSGEAANLILSVTAFSIAIPSTAVSAYGLTGLNEIQIKLADDWFIQLGGAGFLASYFGLLLLLLDKAPVSALFLLLSSAWSIIVLARFLRQRERSREENTNV